MFLAIWIRASVGEKSILIISHSHQPCFQHIYDNLRQRRPAYNSQQLVGRKDKKQRVFLASLIFAPTSFLLCLHTCYPRYNFDHFHSFQSSERLTRKCNLIKSSGACLVKQAINSTKSSLTDAQKYKRKPKHERERLRYLHEPNLQR